MTPMSRNLPRAPAWSMALALLIWGWQTGFLPFAIPMLTGLELARRVSWRWDISGKEFNQIADLSGVAFFITVVYVFMAEGARGIFVILSLMPFILYVVVILQIYSERGRTPLAALFISLRRLDAKLTPEAGEEVDLTMPYVLVCLISASSGNIRTDAFLVACALVIGMLLWTVRARAARPLTWTLLMLCALGISWALQEGIRDVQRQIEASIMGLFDQFMWRYRDPDRANTAIGSLGRLKFSDRIQVRVRPDRPLTAPLLLREASYQVYGYGVWSNPASEFEVVDATGGGIWPLTDSASTDSTRISVELHREVEVIPLPTATARVSETSAFELTRNRYGTVRMEALEGWVDYRADYGGAGQSVAPEAGDLFVMDTYREDFGRLVEELGLADLSPTAAIDRVMQFFNEGFSYSLEQGSRFPRGKYLQHFLFTSRRGHCEYFATSTVLLLRSAGIPARYAVGYAVDEFSSLEGSYVARARDAHSWAEAWIDGAWHVVDTTPPLWSALEDDSASLFQPLLDLYAFISYRLGRQTPEEESVDDGPPVALLSLLIPLLLVLGWRLYFRDRVRHGTLAATADTTPVAGSDSAFYRLIESLRAAGFERRDGETLAVWVARLQTANGLPALDRALALHYRYRFDPDGETDAVRTALTTEVERLLTDGRLDSGPGREQHPH